VLYPMKCPNRAAERRADTTALLASKGYTRVLDMTAEESGESPAYFEVFASAPPVPLPPQHLAYTSIQGVNSDPYAFYISHTHTHTHTTPFHNRLVHAHEVGIFTPAAW
jgi:hypothetical protein